MSFFNSFKINVTDSILLSVTSLINSHTFSLLYLNLQHKVIDLLDQLCISIVIDATFLYFYSYMLLIIVKTF